MKFAREGMPFITSAAAVALVACSVALLVRSWPFEVLALVLVVIALWVPYFFRDPERTGERGDTLVVAPADGRVLLISTVDEPAFMKGPATKISIFMNVLNVHVNRYPASGIVRYVQYNPGRFLHAAADKSSLENEQMSVGVEAAGSRRVLVRQIAGAIARRIVTYSKEGDAVRQGERFGLIRFGSRVDVFFPVASRVRVKVGQHTQAGTTVLAELS
ncbi:MAG: phosphatidylserine decarboxylase family protein [Gemmatimonadales bacterium]